MDAMGILAFTFALPALAFGIRNHERINKLEKKLKDFDVIPKEFDSERPGKERPSQD
jgi:hypothetical protein